MCVSRSGHHIFLFCDFLLRKNRRRPIFSFFSIENVAELKFFRTGAPVTARRSHSNPNEFRRSLRLSQTIPRNNKTNAKERATIQKSLFENGRTRRGSAWPRTNFITYSGLKLNRYVQFSVSSVRLSLTSWRSGWEHCAL